MEGGEITTIVTFWMLKKQWTVASVILLVLASTLPLAAAAASAKPSCPTAGRGVDIWTMNSDPKSVASGATVTTSVAIYYLPHTLGAVVLSPLTISFRWVGAAGEKIVENAPVVQVGNYYTYTQTVGDDFPTGTVTIFVVACSCSDGQGNSGPTTDVSSDSTEAADSSIIEIGATAPTSSGGIPGFPMESILIGLVTAFAILALLRRRHTTDKTSSVRAPEW